MLRRTIFPGLEITNDLCAWMRTERVLILSDLHIGLEAALAAEGLHLPHMQAATMRERLLSIMDRYEPDQVIILGDLKHDFARNAAQEWLEVQSVLRVIREQAEVLITRGNHDNYLASIAASLDIKMEDNFVCGGVHFAHGHAKLPDRPLVIGHEHPSVRLQDRVGGTVKLPCFLHLVNEQLLVLPAFSPLAPGMDLTLSQQALSPLIDAAALLASQVYGCSEIGLLPLGTLQGLSEMRL
ncbi:MAG: metallophosphoesterase [Methanomassiliicoccales archaeon]